MSTQINTRGDALSAELTAADVDQVVRDLQTSGRAHDSSASAVASTARTQTPPRPRGFQATFSSQAPWPPGGESGPGLSPPKPLPKRPKGRFLVGAIFFSVVAAILGAVWNSFIGVVAYGVVTGETLPVRAPWDGIVSEVLVEDGELVAVGQALAVLTSPELMRRREQVEDELRIEQARVLAETERLRRESREHAVECFELEATLLQTQQDHNRAVRELKRARALDASLAVSERELDRLVFAEAGLREKVTRLERAVDELNGLAAPKNGQAESGIEFDQLRPVLQRIVLLQSELTRIDEQLEEGTLRSTVKGIVVLPDLSPGRQIARLEPVMDVIDRDSLQVTLFVPQDETASFSPESEVRLQVEPQAGEVECRVVSARQRFESAPEAIRKYYSSGEPLLPVRVRPSDAAVRETLRPGAVARLSLLSRLR